GQCTIDSRLVIHLSRMLDGVVDPEARIAQPDRKRPASTPTLLLSQGCQRTGSGVATPGCDEDDVYRVDVSPGDGFHSKGAPPCEPAGGQARCALGSRKRE